jgi:hypothetical protein
MPMPLAHAHPVKGMPLLFGPPHATRLLPREEAHHTSISSPPPKNKASDLNLYKYNPTLALVPASGIMFSSRFLG